MNEVLELSEVHAGYGKTSVLNGVSLDVREGELVALLGPNGSGKSTIAKTIMALSTFYSGRIVFKGRDLKSVSTWRRTRLGLGYVPQVENVFRTLSVRENLTIASRGRANRGGEVFDEIYDLFPILRERSAVAAGNLSGGERRMLAFAATLIQRPELLVLDEPTSDLAPAAIDMIFEKIVEVRGRFNVPILMIEQNVERALDVADRVCILVRGRLVMEKDASDVEQSEVGAIFLERVASQ